MLAKFFLQHKFNLKKKIFFKPKFKNFSNFVNFIENNQLISQF